MSRPPRTRTRRPVSGQPDAAARTIDYLPLEHAELLALERRLADEAFGLSQPDAEGDFAGTLMELSALAGHVLGLYQDRHAGEAFLATARLPRSLARHARRLGHAPRPAVAATGYVRLTAKGEPGRVEAGFALASTGAGAPQDYETLEDVEVDPARNVLLPRDAYVPWGDDAPRYLEVPGLRLGLAPGDVIALGVEGRGAHAREVREVLEVPARKATRLWTTEALPPFPGASAVTLFARPKTRAHLFGVHVPAPDVSDVELQTAALDPEPPSSPGASFGWRVSPPYTPAERAGWVAHELYLAEELRSDASRAPVVRVDRDGLRAFSVGAARPVTVTFQKWTTSTVTIPVPTRTDPLTIPATSSTTASRAVTALSLVPPAVDLASAWRERQEPRSSLWLLEWQLRVEVPLERPNETSAGGAITLEGGPRGLAPGMYVALASAPHAEPDPSLRSGEPDVEIARVTRVTSEGGRTVVRWQVVQPSEGARVWRVCDLAVHGNVAPVSHGRTVAETLGDSDGVSAHQRLPLRQPGLTWLPAPGGAEPALEVRVDGVRWERVEHFEASGPHDRHYVLLRDEDGAHAVMFGDGARGAVPPSGRRTVTARYRVGAGPAGDAAAGSVSQIRKAHRLVERASNPRPIAGGTAADGPEAVRSNAARYLRTFDRAVSVDDHADLALRFPGVVRARASWAALPGRGVDGVLVVAADAEGRAPDLDRERGGFLRFMDARRDTSVPLEAVGPTAVRLYARVAVGVDRAFEQERVLAAVRDALHGRRPEAPGLFSFLGREAGQPAFLSEVHARVERVPGVTTVRVEHLSTAPPSAGRAPPRDVIVVAPRAWLSLAPDDLDLAAQEDPR